MATRKYKNSKNVKKIFHKTKKMNGSGNITSYIYNEQIEDSKKNKKPKKKSNKKSNISSSFKTYMDKINKNSGPITFGGNGKSKRSTKKIYSDQTKKLKNIEESIKKIIDNSVKITKETPISKLEELDVVITSFEDVKKLEEINEILNDLNKEGGKRVRKTRKYKR